MALFSNDHETLDLLNNLLGDFCIANSETYDTKIILNLRSTFKEVADFYNAFKSFEKQYNYKKENSPDFENALKIWITEIKNKVQIERAEHKPFNPLDPERSEFSLVSNVYWKTVTVKGDNIFTIHHNLFSAEYPDRQRRSTQEYIYKLLQPKLFEIATGYVYAYKLPELEKELIELANEKNINKLLQNKNHDGNMVIKNRLDGYLKNYDILLSVCNHLTKMDWNHFNKNETANHSLNFSKNGYDELVTCIEQDFSNNNEHQNQKLFNIVSLNLNTVNKKIIELNFINATEELRIKNIDCLRVDSGPFVIFYLDFLDLPVKVHMNLTLGSFYDYIKRKFEQDMVKLNGLFSLKSLNVIEEPLQESPENLIHFKNASQKYLLLNELGIVDFLNQNYPLTSNAKKGLLLAYITDTKTGKPFENILSAVFNKNTENEHYPFKERNEMKVNQILAEVGIDKKTKISAIKKK
ncbi:MAG: hypothetical protein ABJB11_19695 [Ferruginibacter sp.]